MVILQAARPTKEAAVLTGGFLLLFSTQSKSWPLLTTWARPARSNWHLACEDSQETLKAAWLGCLAMLAMQEAGREMESGRGGRGGKQHAAWSVRLTQCGAPRSQALQSRQGARCRSETCAVRVTSTLPWP
jgi:hypothetical protein